MVQTAIDKNKVSVSTYFMEGLLPVVGDRVQPKFGHERSGGNEFDQGDSKTID